MISAVLFLFICYYVYRNAVSLCEFYGAWDTPQWLLLGVTVLMVPAAVFTAIRAVREFKAKANQAAEEEQAAAQRREEAAKAKFLEDAADLDVVYDDSEKSIYDE